MLNGLYVHFLNIWTIICMSKCFNWINSFQYIPGLNKFMAANTKIKQPLIIIASNIAQDVRHYFRFNSYLL